MTTAPSKTIALEEHATFPSLGDDLPFYNEIWKVYPTQRASLKDHGAGRLADMDGGNLTVQVMSHLPGLANNKVDGCRAANDEMAAAIKANPSRFRGFAALPMAFPDAAAAELERAVTQLGFVGAMIDDHLEDMTQYDGERFWPVFAMAERLDVPIYIHPAPVDEATLQSRFSGNYSHKVAFGLSRGGYGWHETLALHILKLWGAGLFEKYPKLKIIIGHNGELLPIWVDRLNGAAFARHAGVSKFEDVWNRNIWVTSSGFFSVRSLEMVLKTVKMDRFMYSIDGPFNKAEVGWHFLEELAQKGTLTQEEIEMFAFGNAKKLLKLDGV